MNQDCLYLTLIISPIIIMMLVSVISFAIAVLVGSAELTELIAKTLAVLFVVGGAYEIAIITYVAMIRLIN